MDKKIKSLSYKSLKVKLDHSHLNFKMTKEIKLMPHVIGQDRAIKAIYFGIDIKSEGYNLFAMGPSGIGKRSLLSKILFESARKKATPPDWCYIYNFDFPHKPIALALPPGSGFIFQQNMKKLVDDLRKNIEVMIESDEYQRSIKTINPISDNDQEKELKKNPKRFCKKKFERARKLQLKLIKLAIASLIKRLQKKYKKYAVIHKYLSDVQKDILENSNDFVVYDSQNNTFSFAIENMGLTKYKVNLFVNNQDLKGAPIIYEENPNYSNLICRIEHTSEQGNITTNFTLIRPGSLHRANGGYLIIDSRKLKKNPEAWEMLKTALYNHQIRIEDVEHANETIKPISLNPEPIPLAIKIILIGDRQHYYSLCQRDDDFTKLFKVAVDFDEIIDRNHKNMNLYARLIASIIAQKRLLPFHVSAISEIIDYTSRLAEDNEKLSTHISVVKDLLIEADYFAKKNNKQTVRANDVKKALDSQTYRLDRSREFYHEDIARGFIIIKVDGKATGQVNCLSVRSVGTFSYGHPTRVTARVYFRKGHAKFIDIQREIKLAGAMHSKAGLIISNILASRYNRSREVSISASIAFEQVYCWTDGDSASVGELCALLSAIAKIPINQSLAITGSIDQYGRVQAVGGVNEKIEGFFDVCAAKGLTGKQGVLIPAINVKSLMLKDAVIAAVRAKEFFIYPIKTLDQAIFLLTGYEAGKRNKEGYFPDGTLNARIEDNIAKFVNKMCDS